MTRHDVRKLNTAKRNSRMLDRFVELYEEKRTRYDDVISTLALEFNISEPTVRARLKSTSKDEQVAQA